MRNKYYICWRSKYLKLKMSFSIGFMLILLVNTAHGTELIGEFSNNKESVEFDPSDKSVIISIQSFRGQNIIVHGNYKVKGNTVYVFDRSGKSFGIFSREDEKLVAVKDSYMKTLFSPKVFKLISFGEKLFFEGLDEPYNSNGRNRSISGCETCHGRNGGGNINLRTPSLLNFSEKEFLSRIKAYKNGQKQDETMYLMNEIAKQLLLKESSAIWNYLEHIRGLSSI